jgi:hypothetical protein
MNAHSVEARLNWLGAITAVACLGYLVSRVFTGIDFTDEMQHYGELASLVATGKLFQADLFLQQAMYMFLYPVFRLYYMIAGGWDHLVIAGRTFMLLAYVAAAWLAYRRSATGSARYPGWAAASVALAWLPFNILSPYYNAMAGLLISLIVFVWAGEARARAYLVVSTLAVSMLCVTYPTLGLAVGVLLVGDELLARRYGLALRMVVFLAGFGSLWAAILWDMTGSLADIRDAIAFSKAFGVGQAFSSPKHLLVLFVIVLAGLAFSYLGARQEGADRRLNGRIAFPLMLLSFWWLASQNGWFLVVLLYLGVLFLLRYVPADVPEKRQVARLGVFGLLIGAVSALTSGNGVINIAIGAGAVLPYLAGLLLKGNVTSGRNANGVVSIRPAHLVILFGVLLVANNVLHPYREEPIWKLGHSLDRVPAFRGITGSEEKRVAVELVQALADSPASLEGKTLLVVGPQPWAYFALRAVPQTPMLFMHYSGGEAATRIVADRLSRQARPDRILVMSQPPAEIMDALDRILRSGYRCDVIVPNLPAGVTGRAMEKFGLGPEMKMCRLGA